MNQKYKLIKPNTITDLSSPQYFDSSESTPDSSSESGNAILLLLDSRGVFFIFFRCSSLAFPRYFDSESTSDSSSSVVLGNAILLLLDSKEVFFVFFRRSSLAMLNKKNSKIVNSFDLCQKLDRYFVAKMKFLSYINLGTNLAKKYNFHFYDSIVMAQVTYNLSPFS